tara:strand:- start:4025 stop:4567 length:543 start_codon:yes stop_codon:yes gene_type:complete
MSIGSSGQNRRQELVALVLQHQSEIFRYVFSLVPNHTDAEDLFQDAIAVICQKFEEFDTDTNFPAWPFKIAYWEVRRARQKHARSKLLFNDEALAAIAAASESRNDEIGMNRQEALTQCLGQLNKRDRRMVLVRYQQDGGVERASEDSGRSVTATYKALSRVRKALQQCINHRIQFESAI